METAEILFVIALLIPLIPMAIARQWWLFGVFAAFYTVFGLIEFISVKTTEHSVSQHFWIYSQEHQGMAIFILITMALMWAGLIWHLATKMLKKKEGKK